MAVPDRPHRPASLAPTLIHSFLPSVGAHSVGEGIAWVQPVRRGTRLLQKHLRFCLSWEPDSSGDGGAGKAASPGKPGSHNTFTARLGLALTSTPTFLPFVGARFIGRWRRRKGRIARQAWLPLHLHCPAWPGSHIHLRFCLSWEPDSSGDGGAGEAASPGKPGSHNTFTARLGLTPT